MATLTSRGLDADLVRTVAGGARDSRRAAGFSGAAVDAAGNEIGLGVMTGCTVDRRHVPVRELLDPRQRRVAVGAREVCLAVDGRRESLRVDVQARLPQRPPGVAGEAGVVGGKEIARRCERRDDDGEDQRESEPAHLWHP